MSQLVLSPSERKVLEVIRYRGAMSRADLARATDLAAPSLSRLIQQLLERGLVLEADRVRGGGRGKPGQLVRIHASGAFTAGLAVQHEYLEGCILDLDGGVRARLSVPLEERAAKQVAPLLTQVLADLMVQGGIPDERLIGVGVSMPGMSMGTYGSGITPAGGNEVPDEFEDWRSLDLRAFFAQALGKPCWLENSSKAVALAEMYYGEGRRLGNFAVVHIAYGFGGGLILDRRPYRGSRGRAGEFGGMFPYTGVRPSGRDLLLYLAERMANPPRHVREIIVNDVPGHLIQAWAERVYPCLHDLCKFLAVALDLEAIVFHGLLPDQVMRLLVELTRQRVPSSLPHEFAMPEVVVSGLSASSLSFGAASLPLHFITASSP